MRNFALTVNGAPITAHEGQSVLEAALAAGIYIPSLCSHPDLKPQGGCKLCLVEVEGQENPVCSCETKAAEGMRVLSDTELVKRLRRTSMELMLASHPTDCTSCSAYLNCELQALMQYLGVAHSRLRSVEKRNVAKSNGLTDPLIKRDMVRCIQCGRCVRACEELRGVGALEMKVENGESYVGVKGASYLDGGCRFCGACIEVCPTGAIQDTPGLFKALKGESLVPCKAECPAHVDIPRYVRFAREKKYSNAVEVLRERLTFPHALGYVCSHKCEFSCKRGHLDEAVSIKEIKKFCLENDKSSSWFLKVKKLEISGKTVGIIGAGPCGLTAAWHLARKGHKVEVFERRPLPGGMLRYGIPKHRLDRSVVDSEAGIITSIGVEIKSGTEITSALSLKERYGAVFIAVGAQLGARAPVDVSGCQNVWQAVEFCALAEQDALPPMGSFVTVLGGGNVALDCARIAVRAGAKRVRVACLESRVAMLAEKDEITAALSEGVEIINGFSSLSAEKKDGKVRSIQGVLIRSFKFGPNGLEIDAISGSEQSLETDTLIIAIGQRIGLEESFGVKLGRGGSVAVDSSMSSSVPGIFAGGDAVTGTLSVVEAIASGRKAASSIDLFLGGDGVIDEEYCDPVEPSSNIGNQEFSMQPRSECFGGCNEALAQSQRCLQCDLRLKISKVKMWTDPSFKKAKREAGA